ncbi:CDG_1a_G0022940.mRNA.1.CDS.1 [Saccharomyces cerevisiae]|nr:CDG_1a_G0022940.mRNA.1.CDS.1 [Saccharomyces cerevisiae]CAI7323204.1 CDG_1a_G0022940.mRNA.1.CDS.1 [Saccharomyces cerevisiae]
MMPAKLQLRRTADPAVQRSSWNANAEKLQLSRRFHKAVSFLPPILPGFFLVPVQKYSYLCLRFTNLLHTLKIQLFDLPSRHAENLAPLLASCPESIH